MDNIFLIGPMGSGKTTIGRRLGPMLGREFIDLDEEMERRCGVQITVIFEIEGEAGFRARERDLLAELAAADDLVLACGGGSVLDADNRRVLRERGLVVFLQANVDQQIRRLERDKRRPLLAAPDRRARLEQLAGQRNPVYRELADLVIPSANVSPARMAQTVAGAIRDHLREDACR